MTTEERGALQYSSVLNAQSTGGDESSEEEVSWKKTPFLYSDRGVKPSVPLLRDAAVVVIRDVDVGMLGIHVGVC